MLKIFALIGCICFGFIILCSLGIQLSWTPEDVAEAEQDPNPRFKMPVRTRLLIVWAVAVVASFFLAWCLAYLRSPD